MFGKEIINKLTIIDDIIPDYLLDMLEEIVYYNTPFSLGGTIKGTSNISNYDLNKEGIGDKIYEQFQLGHTSMTQKLDNPHATINDVKIMHYDRLNWNHYFLIPLQMALAKYGYKVELNNILRIKTNLQTQAHPSTKGKYNFPHIDVPLDLLYGKAFTGIFYLNESDGETYIFNEDINHDIDKLTIKEIIKPQRGRFVMFPAHWMHAGSHPINSPFRIVINYNFFPLRMLG